MSKPMLPAGIPAAQAAYSRCQTRTHQQFIIKQWQKVPRCAQERGVMETPGDSPEDDLSEGQLGYS